MTQSRDELYAARARGNKIAAIALITFAVTIMVVFMVLTHQRNSDKLDGPAAKSASTVQQDKEAGKDQSAND